MKQTCRLILEERWGNINAVRKIVGSGGIASTDNDLTCCFFRDIESLEDKKKNLIDSTFYSASKEEMSLFSRMILQ